MFATELAGRSAGNELARCKKALADIVTDLAAHIRDALPRRFSELAVFDARLYIRVRRIDEPA
jgi:hypothetical protein